MNYEWKWNGFKVKPQKYDTALNRIYASSKSLWQLKVSIKVEWTKLVTNYFRWYRIFQLIIIIKKNKKLAEKLSIITSG